MGKNADATATGPLFQEDWWLDAATDGQWDRVEVARDGQTIASFPFWRYAKRRLTYIENPPLTRTLTPQLSLPAAKPVNRLMSEITLLGELMNRLPQHDRFELTLPAGTGLIFPYVSLGYTVTHKFTFVTDPADDLDALRAGMEQKTRNLANSASKKFTVQTHTDLDRFFAVARVQYAEGSHLPEAALTRVFAACEPRNCTAVISAVDQRGSDAAAAVLVWDGETLYYLLSARDPERSRAGANTLLIWEAMCYAQERGMVFDADGFDKLEGALFLARFGLRPVVRPVVNRGGRRKNLLSPERPDLTYRAE